jgi:general secretion pathway protein A
LYLQFFGLNEAPFSITPDPAFVYLSAAHRDALAHLLYGVGQGGSGGFVQLTGEVGTGKTTLCRCLLEQVPENTKVALVLNPLMTPRELLATICEELGIDTTGRTDSSKALVDALNRYLLDQHARGRRVVVVIDEAQNLSPEALEQVRLLTNLETAKDKLLNMVLLGQPELRQLLQRQNLRQLSQRITARYHLVPLDQEETRAYVRHRMKVAGAQRNPFRRSAMRALYQRSQGVPRLINIIADRALAGAYAKELATITPRLVNSAASEVQPSEARVRTSRWPLAAATASIAILLLVTLWMLDLPALRDLRTVSGSHAATENRLVVAPAEAEVAAEGSGREEAGAKAGLPAVAMQNTAVGAIDPQVEEAAASLPVLDPDWLEIEHRTAWQSLAALWQDPEGAIAVQAACEGAIGSGYACLAEQGNWSRIRQLGLPVILVLRGQQSRHLLLRGFSGPNLLVGSGDDTLEVSREPIEERWFGEYYLAWPQAPDWPVEIRLGESGAAVDIIMEMASLADPGWAGTGVFDSGFETWLRSFQRRHGLKADGIVGPITLIHLMAPTIAQPRLVLVNEENS